MKVFYHNDNDGKSAAALVYIYAKNILKQELSKEDFIEVNYVTSVPNASKIRNGEMVYIVDYSFNNNTLKYLREIKNKTDNVVWFDHHKSSLEILLTVQTELLVSYSVIDINRCGAMITYDTLIKNNNINNKENIYNIIKLVDDYDRWIHQYSESLLFNIGSQCYDLHPMSDFWINACIDKIVKEGSIIKRYKDLVNINYCDRFAYTCTINNHKCIVFNTPESSSQAFPNLYEKYKLAIRFEFDGNLYNYSIYSDLEDIDCAEISKSLNPAGGGHKGAAGFTSDKLLFLPNLYYEF